MNQSTKESNIGKKAFKSGVWYVISDIVVKGIGFLSTPIFARLLTQEEYGVVSTFNSWCALLLTFCTLNLTYSIGRAKIDYSEDLDRYIGSMQILSAFVTGGMICIGIIFIKPLQAFLELDLYIIIWLFAYLFFVPIIKFFQNGYRYRYQYKQNIAIAWYTAFSNVLLSLAFVLLLDGNKAYYRIAGMVIPSIILSIVLWTISFKRKQLKIKLEYWKYGLQLSLPIILHTVCLNILAQMDRIYIQKIWGMQWVAIYSVAYSYGSMIYLFTNGISNGWLPWFHDSFHDGEFDRIKINVKKIVVLGCYIGLASIAFAPEFIYIMGGEDYMDGVRCVVPIVLGVVCQYIYTHYVNIEMHLKKSIYVSIGTVIAAIINLGLNIWLIPKFGYVAAAYTTFFSYAVLLLLHYSIVRFVLKVYLYDDKFMFGAIGITFIIGMLISFMYNTTNLRYIVIAIGFLSFLFVYRDYLRSFIGKIIRKK